MQDKSFGHNRTVNGAKLSYDVGAKMSTPFFLRGAKMSIIYINQLYDLVRIMLVVFLEKMHFISSLNIYCSKKETHNPLLFFKMQILRFTR